MGTCIKTDIGSTTCEVHNRKMACFGVQNGIPLPPHPQPSSGKISNESGPPFFLLLSYLGLVPPPHLSWYSDNSPI